MKFSKEEEYLRKKSIELGQEVTVQEFISGIEVYISVLDTDPIWVLPPQVLNLNGKELPANNFLKFEDNMLKKAISFRKANMLSSGTIDELEISAKKSFRALGLSGLSRLDYRVVSVHSTT